MRHLRWSLTRRTLDVLVTGAVVRTLMSCATQPAPPSQDLPGFFSGLLHGFLIMFGFIGSLFTDYRIYAFPNAGGWYDLGYLLGASMFLGGGGAGSRARRLRRC